MITLILAILGSASFGLIVKAAHRRGCNLLAVGLINYVVAAAIYGIMTIDLPPAESITASLGHAGGLFFATAFFLLTRVLRTRGISISAAILQLTVLFPVTVGIFVWGEQVNWVQMVGILLSLLALPLLSIDPTYPFSLKGAGLRLTCGLLVAGGCCQLTMQSFHYLSVPVDRSHLFLYIFGTAVFFSALSWVLVERKMCWRDLFYGSALGVSNCLGGYMLITSMQTLPGMVVFPVTSAAALLLTMMVAWHYWDERLGRYARFGMIVTLCAVVCVNFAR